MYALWGAVSKCEAGIPGNSMLCSDRFAPARRVHQGSGRHMRGHVGGPIGIGEKRNYGCERATEPPPPEPGETGGAGLFSEEPKSAPGDPLWRRNGRGVVDLVADGLRTYPNLLSGEKANSSWTFLPLTHQYATA